MVHNLAIFRRMFCIVVRQSQAARATQLTNALAHQVCGHQRRKETCENQSRAEIISNVVLKVKEFELSYRVLNARFFPSSYNNQKMGQTASLYYLSEETLRNFITNEKIQNYFNSYETTDGKISNPEVLLQIISNFSDDDLVTLKNYRDEIFNGDQSIGQFQNMVEQIDRDLNSRGITTEGTYGETSTQILVELAMDYNLESSTFEDVQTIDDTLFLNDVEVIAKILRSLEIRIDTLTDENIEKQADKYFLALRIMLEQNPNLKEQLTINVNDPVSVENEKNNLIQNEIETREKLQVSFDLWKQRLASIVTPDDASASSNQSSQANLEGRQNANITTANVNYNPSNQSNGDGKSSVGLDVGIIILIIIESVLFLILLILVGVSVSVLNKKRRNVTKT